MVPAIRRLHTGQHGQTLLEFAFVAPLLLVFLLGLVDFGIAIDRRLVLDHAVREGARYASVGGDALNGSPADANDVRVYMAGQSQGIINPAASPGDNGYAEVCYDSTGGVSIAVDYTHDFVTGFTSFFNTPLTSIVMDPSASARVEQAVPGIPSCS